MSAEVNKVVRIERVAGNVTIGDSPEYRVGSAINALLSCLAVGGVEFVRFNGRATPETVKKIKHNNLREKRHIVSDYLEFSSKIEDAYLDADRMVPFGKNIILRNLRSLYCQALDFLGIEYLLEDPNIDQIRENADFIVDFVIVRLRNLVFETQGTPECRESIDLGVNVVVAHAFIECIILENPENVASARV